MADRQSFWIWSSQIFKGASSDANLIFCFIIIVWPSTTAYQILGTWKSIMADSDSHFKSDQFEFFQAQRHNLIQSVTLRIEFR